MKRANAALFEGLITFSEAGGYPVPSPQAARWVHANKAADEILIRAEVKQSISFGGFHHLAWVEFEEEHFIASFGFESEIADPNLLVLDDVQGFDVCLLSELRVSPRVRASEVFNVVAAGNREDDPEYGGHERDSIMGLFPEFQVYKSETPLDLEVLWPIFLSFCAFETRRGGSWIEGPLSEALGNLAASNLDSFPYQELCRSTLDLDPRSLFMSLYRCIEATYAHDKATRLKNALSIQKSWNEIAAHLEQTMSWRPLEAESLNNVLRHAENEHLSEIAACLNVEQGKNMAEVTGKAIYKLRNKIVHYRPSHDQVDFDAIDWNRLCRVLVAITIEVFGHAYSSK